MSPSAGIAELKAVCLHRKANRDGFVQRVHICPCLAPWHICLPKLRLRSCCLCCRARRGAVCRWSPGDSEAAPATQTRGERAVPALPPCPCRSHRRLSWLNSCPSAPAPPGACDGAPCTAPAGTEPPNCARGKRHSQSPAHLISPPSAAGSGKSITRNTSTLHTGNRSSLF